MNKTIVTSNTGPDLDGIACAIAYAELLGKNYFPAMFGSSEKEVLFVFKKFRFELPKNENIDIPNCDVVLVDSSSRERFPEELDPNRVVEVIDHRLYTSSDIFKNAKIQKEHVGACATMIAEKFNLDKSLIKSVPFAEYNQSRKARRPQNSYLNVSKFETEFGKGILKTVEGSVDQFKSMTY